MRRVDNPTQKTIAIRKWREINPHYCADCNTIISHKATRCQHCNQLWRWKTGALNKSHFPRGEKSPYWKGGRVNNSGYIMVYNPSHHRATKKHYVMEHIIIWEQASNKLLPDSWIIHHLNGITTDNRPINLQALPSKKHYLILRAKAKRIQELEGLLNNQHQLL